MDASLFVRKPNTPGYTSLGKKTFAVLPRVDEFISADWEGVKYFQVVALHHVLADGGIDIYAVEGEPPWLVKKARAIGFGS